MTTSGRLRDVSHILSALSLEPTAAQQHFLPSFTNILLLKRCETDIGEFNTNNKHCANLKNPNFMQEVLSRMYVWRHNIYLAHCLMYEYVIVLIIFSDLYVFLLELK